MKKFNEASFAAFEAPDLASRMEKIQETIQPVFLEIGEPLTEILAKKIGQDMHLHIAKHIRRTVYPPEATWCAISTNKRGYKMEAHFQLRIDEEGVAFLLSMIDQPKKQKDYGEVLRSHAKEIQKLPHEFILSKDHTTNQFFSLHETFAEALAHFVKVKKSELELGRYFSKEDVLKKSGEEFFIEIEKTLETLEPLYKNLLKS